MKVAIMQPYFFPYLGYFQLINAVDKFLLLEDVQFITHGWIERNRIINYQKEWSYINVPLVKHSRNTLIKDIKIRSNESWKEKLISQLVHYKNKSKYYEDIVELVNKAISIETDNLTELNYNILLTLCSYLDINTEIKVFDSKEYPILLPQSPDEWALNICMALGGVDTYINSEGGKLFFDTEKYNQQGITVDFIKSMLNPYYQRRDEFVKGLSIIDVLMFNSKEDVKLMLDEYTIIGE